MGAGTTADEFELDWYDGVTHHPFDTFVIDGAMAVNRNYGAAPLPPNASLYINNLQGAAATCVGTLVYSVAGA